MANTFQESIPKILSALFPLLRNNAVMPRLVRTDWSSQVREAGDTITVRLPGGTPVRTATVGSTPVVPQDVDDRVAKIELKEHHESVPGLTDKASAEIFGGTPEFIRRYFGGTMRNLVEHINVDVLDLYKDIPHAVGTAGTTPFASDLGPAYAARRVLTQNRAEPGDRHIVLDPYAQEKASSLAIIQSAQNRRSGEDSLVTGNIGRVAGFDWYEDQQVPEHTKGTQTGLVAAETPSTAGATAIAVDTTAGTLVKGDLLTIGTTTHVVTEDVAVGATSVPIYPALTADMAANDTVAITASHNVSLAFHRDAFALAVRPLMPPNGFTGGNLFDQMTDSVTGLTMSLEVSRQNSQNAWKFSILYGVGVLDRNLAVRIMG